MARPSMTAVRGLVALPVSVAVLLAAGCGPTGRNTPGPTGSAPGASATGATAAARVPGTSSATGVAPFFAPDGAAILGPTPVAIQAGDFYFRPDALTVRPGTRAELAITNVSTEPHSFDLPALGVRLALPPGRTEAVAFAAPARAGTYYFWCQSPGQADAGMVGRLTVG